MGLQARKNQVKALVADAVNVTNEFVTLAHEGILPKGRAQTLALEILGAARFDHGNYYFVYDEDGTMLQNAEKGLIGKNMMNAKDPYGHYVIRPMLKAAVAGHPIFHEYYWPKAGSKTPQPKISYMAKVPDWHWVIGSGLYLSDLRVEFWSSVRQFLLIFVPIFAVFLALMYLMQRNISSILRAMASTMTELSKGDFRIDIPFTSRSDEIGGMAKSVEVFKAAGIEKSRLENDAREAQRQKDAERAEAEAARQAGANQLAFVVKSVASGLEKLASGSLVYRLDAPFASEYEPLRIDFNAAMDRLQEAMKLIAANTAALRSGTGEISAAADDLARRTEQQAASLEETSATLDEITATVRKTAEGAGHARGVVGTAEADAQRSGTVVAQAVAAMSQIENSSQQISNIIGVIDEIAFQTNLLALNAGVEAARAGDAGRGFAVVASEVRALAQRSADAAKEIKTLIQTSGQQVISGVDLVGQTGKALEQIVGQIGEINSIVAEIAISAQEQSSGLHQVNTAVNQMDQVTQQNAAMVEQSTAASHNLARETEALVALVGRFEIGAVTQQSMRQVTRNAAVPKRPIRNPHRVSHLPAHEAPPRKLEMADSDDWEDF